MNNEYLSVINTLQSLSNIDRYSDLNVSTEKMIELDLYTYDGGSGVQILEKGDVIVSNTYIKVIKSLLGNVHILNYIENKTNRVMSFLFYNNIFFDDVILPNSVNSFLLESYLFSVDLNLKDSALTKNDYEKINVYLPMLKNMNIKTKSDINRIVVKISFLQHSLDKIYNLYKCLKKINYEDNM